MHTVKRPKAEEDVPLNNLTVMPRNARLETQEALRCKRCLQTIQRRVIASHEHVASSYSVAYDREAHRIAE